MEIPTRDQILDLLRQHHDDIAAYGVSSIALFGSVVRNEATAESDVDLLVEFDRPVGLFHLIDLQMYLESMAGVDVDLVTKNGLRQRIKEDVLREAVNI